MEKYTACSRAELLDLHRTLLTQYEEIKSQGLKLDMSRGKPDSDQLALSQPMLDLLKDVEDTRNVDGVDLRNYGVLDGIRSCKELMASLLGRPAEEVFVGGNSSLNLMFDVLADAVYRGMPESECPWGQVAGRKFLCPVPGYDRHFMITEYLGFELVPVPMDEHGPDMDLVEQLAGADADIKGIWCVPKYSNPSGITYSDEVVRRLAAMSPAAKDFRIFWDNAYCVHDLDPDHGDQLLDLMAECEKQGTQDRVFQFCSTSKITFPGGGVSAFACSESNMTWQKKRLNVQTLGYDKLNMARHAQFLKDRAGVTAQMRKHAALLRPKFETALGLFSAELGELGIAEWTQPHGGYFITFYAMEGCAKAIVERCRQAGVVLTAAGSTHPYKQDPEDRTIRIAPSYPPVDLLRQCMEVFCLCVKLVSVEKLLAEKL